MSSYEARFKVWRGDVKGGGLEDFAVEVNDGEVVLDASSPPAPGDPRPRTWPCAGTARRASAVRARRRSTGPPARLMCMTRMSVFTREETITVTPLRAFPVVQDIFA